jgi:acetoin utilization deacetylase AcuC-like enzyme
MRIITDNRCAGYAQPGHPERPERITETQKLLKTQQELPLAWAKPSRADDATILRAHAPEHLARLSQPLDFDDDTPFFTDIEEHARSSAGAALDALKAARGGEMAFSLMRPPGHHAKGTTAMGFCYLNNIAIAALEALASGVRRIAVYDFDVHHGNGTEAILLEHPRAAFFSVHQYPCYPGTGIRNLGDNVFNYPVPPKVSRDEYRETLSRALGRLQYFRPELVAVSAGFDGYVHDPLAQGTLELEDFHWLGQSLRKLNLPLFTVLEGGYSHDLPNLILAYLKGLEDK